jgi:iron-sulfur cluster repair protein YtfE (RIC family)
MEFWGWMTIGIIGLLLSLCMGAKYSMRFAWEQKKKELEQLNEELEQMEELTDELRLQKEEIVDLLQNEFLDYSALFKRKINVD